MSRQPPRSLLLVHGAPERGPRVAAYYGSEEAYFPGFNHWDIVADLRVRVAIARFFGVQG